MRESRRLDGKVVFSARRGRSSSFLVRGIQVAPHCNGVALRKRYLSEERLKKAAGLVWVAEPDPVLAKKFQGKVHQAVDIVQRWSKPLNEQLSDLAIYDGFIVNTMSMAEEVLQHSRGKPVCIVQHHHCNTSGFRIPSERLEKPKLVGYVGAPDHLHDADAIRKCVEKLGLNFGSFGPFELARYYSIDIGIAWTHEDPSRTKYRSNVKHANFCAFGIPSVLPKYESYVTADAELGAGTCLFASNTEEMLRQLEKLIADAELRMKISKRAVQALTRYSLPKIGEAYRSAFDKLFR